MLGDSENRQNRSSARRAIRRKRVQKRSLPPRDIWDPSKNDTESHPRSRLGRRKATGWGIGIMACLALGLSLPYAFRWAIADWDESERAPRLARLVIETDGHLRESAIAEASGVIHGANLSRLDLTEIQERIETLPSVKSAELRRRYPDELGILVEERIPVAWLSCPDHGIRPLRPGGLLIDREGVVFAGTDPTRLPILPTIEVLGIPPPAQGGIVDSMMVNRALRLVDLSSSVFAGRGMELIDVRAINNWGLLCRYPDDLLVTLHIERIQEGLRDLDAIIRKTDTLHVKAATINLASMKNIPITFHSEMSRQKWQNSTATVP